MKLANFGSSAVAVLMSSMAMGASAPVPNDKIFDQVMKAAQSLGYRGHDSFVCLNADNTRVVLGGVTIWGDVSKMPIFMVNPDQSLAPTTFIAPMTYSLPDGRRVSLTLGQPRNIRNIAQWVGYLTVSPLETAQILNCALRNSGLE